MKKPISWHKECLANRIVFMCKKEKTIEQLETEVFNDENEIDFYKTQIDLAEERGLKEFDNTRLGVKRTKEK